MLEGLSSVTVIDLVIGLTLFEGLALALYHRRTGKGVPVGDFAVNLVSGLCLMLALRAAVTDAAWHWIGLWLTVAGGAHATDLMRRWRR